jgi:hypothetical protein
MPVAQRHVRWCTREAYGRSRIKVSPCACVRRGMLYENEVPEKMFNWSFVRFSQVAFFWGAFPCAVRRRRGVNKRVDRDQAYCSTAGSALWDMLFVLDAKLQRWKKGGHALHMQWQWKYIYTGQLLYNLQPSWLEIWPTFAFMALRRASFIVHVVNLRSRSIWYHT